MKAYIVLNRLEGWKVVKDGNHVDCTKPIYHSYNTNKTGLKQCRLYCETNNIGIIRICQ